MLDWRLVFSAVALGVTSLAACGSPDVLFGTTSSSVGVGGSATPCPSGQESCDGVCVDVRYDPAHCGACGNECKTGQVCSEAVCAVQCSGGTTKCEVDGQGLRCIDTNVDPAHCGGCNKACGADESCVFGACAVKCFGGTTVCMVPKPAEPGTGGAGGGAGGAGGVGGAGTGGGGGAAPADMVAVCVDTQLDAKHCGGCGVACPEGQSCQAGACVIECVGGSTKCLTLDAQEVCADLSLDPDFCGDCSTKCASGQACQNGKCVTACAGESTKCQDAFMKDICVNTKNDAKHCGGCGKGCAAGLVCAKHACSLDCAGGATKCNNTCTKLATDPMNCGQCGKICGGANATAFCAASMCDIKCNASFGDCNANKVDGCEARLDTVQNCGGCGNVCGAGSGCKNGDCVPLEVTQLAASGHTCALLNDGNVKCWGDNLSGQLGLGDAVNRGDGPNEMGSALPVVNLGTGKRATSIAAGGSHTCALLTDNSVKCWGRNANGQLGQGDTATRGDEANEMGDKLLALALGLGKTVKLLATGENHGCAILNDDTVKCWGSNAFGQLGLGDVAARGDNANEMGAALPIVALGTGKTAKALALGDAHSCAILNDNTVKCWGGNGDGQLGLGDKANRGDGANEMGDALPVVSLGVGKTAKAIVARGNHTCALLSNGTVKCWGSNAFGQLGQGDSAERGDGPNEMGDSLLPIDLGLGLDGKLVLAGNNFTCAVVQGDQVKCWGWNTAGQLGQGDTMARGDALGEMADALLPIDLGTGRTAKSLAVGLLHACALLDNGAVKCWGGSAAGQLGLGDTQSRGDGLGEMGDALPAVSVY